MTGAKLAPVIVSKVHRGTGHIDDPHRIVTQVHTTRGDFVTEYDPCSDPALRQSDPVWTVRILEDTR